MHRPLVRGAQLSPRSTDMASSRPSSTRSGADGRVFARASWCCRTAATRCRAPRRGARRRPYPLALRRSSDLWRAIGQPTFPTPSEDGIRGQSARLKPTPRWRAAPGARARRPRCSRLCSRACADASRWAERSNQHPVGARRHALLDDRARGHPGWSGCRALRSVPGIESGPTVRHRSGGAPLGDVVHVRRVVWLRGAPCTPGGSSRRGSTSDGFLTRLLYENCRERAHRAVPPPVPSPLLQIEARVARRDGRRSHEATMHTVTRPVARGECTRWSSVMTRARSPSGHRSRSPGPRAARGCSAAGTWPPIVRWRHRARAIVDDMRRPRA